LFTVFLFFQPPLLLAAKPIKLQERNTKLLSNQKFFFTARVSLSRKEREDEDIKILK